MEDGKGYWEDYIKAISTTLNRALKTLPIIEERKGNLALSPSEIANIDTKEISPISKRGKSGWAAEYDRCIRCGTDTSHHVARGLCSSCYGKEIDSRHKNKNRIRRYKESSSILTVEYYRKLCQEREIAW
jgi:ribosomal protein L37E